MRTHRFIGDFNFSGDRIEIGDPDIVRQMRSVLRLEVGKEVILGNGNKDEVVAVIAEIKKNSIEFQVVKRMKNMNEPKIEVVLYCAILKSEHFEFVVEKATEVGVHEIVPILTERTVKLDVRVDRLSKIAREAAEQSGRGIVPLVRDHLTFNNAMTDAERNDMNFFLHADKKARDFRETSPEKSKRVGIFVGPEGGWTDNEVNLVRKSKFVVATLGKLTLRSETAAIVASYLALQND